MSLEIRVDRDACRGASECLRRAPRSFRLGEDDRARPIDPPGDPEAAILEAARACPHFAIEVHRGERRLA